ncbi:S-adenosyl-L-methionine-dependent methyltransferase [Penicillium lagena]|uniref:S-adenosyl-L-methionine-dependent methyltransferase n=1 Tax=Penicillium lagena TaxID=94218 RepID=UPI00254078F8|nr:S-adenosyl-L-methionine-dependent methyltransferase [Penicillium lagena]KAJ5612589.1 S-adenosyl-L-methionine-dependent methyltransferase [Penicillium lagena]
MVNGAHQEGDELYNEKASNIKGALELTHRLFVSLNNGKLHRAPLGRPKFALDLGCGSGTWTIDFAKANPSCEVIGIDINPGPCPSDVPNCRFVSGDIQSAWTWLPEQPIDFLHIRGLVGFIQSWSGLLRKALNCLAPGGWIEIADISYVTFSDDGSLDQADGLRRFDKMFEDTLARMGDKLETPSLLGQIVADVGFQNTSVTKRKLPFSDFSDNVDMKEIAESSAIFHRMDATIIAERGLQPVLNLSAEEVESVLADALRDMDEPKIKAYRHG